MAQRRSTSGPTFGNGVMTCCSSMSRSTGRQRSVLCRRALARSVNHVSSCSWKSSSFAKQRPGSKLRSRKSCSRSTTPLACGSRGSQKNQPTRSAPQKAANSIGRAPAARVKASLAIPDQGLRQRSKRPQAAADPEQQVRDLLGEDQRAGARARVPEARHHHVALARLSVPDRHLVPGLPQVELARSLRAGRSCAETSSPAGTTGGHRASSHRRSSCRHRTPAARSARESAVRQISASALSSRWISSLNGSSFDPLAARR